MSNLFQKLSVIEEDQKNIEKIQRLQEAFNDVKSTYSKEYSETLTTLLEQFKTKLKSDHKIVQAVNIYLDKYVSFNQRAEAEEELYNMLSAELLQTFQALSHTSCAIC